MERRIAPSARIEADIEALLLGWTDQPDRLSKLGRLGAQLILQRAVEDEVTAFLGRARYERTPTRLARATAPSAPAPDRRGRDHAGHAPGP